MKTGSEALSNQVKWYFLQKINRGEKIAIKSDIDQQLQQIAAAHPPGLPLTFFGNPDSGFVSLEYVPVSEQTDPHIAGIYFGIYAPHMDPNELLRVGDSKVRCLSLPFETIMRVSLSGSVSANFNVNRYPDVYKYGIPYGGIHVIPHETRTREVAFLPSPIGLISTNYLAGIQHNLSIVMRRAGIAEPRYRRLC